MSAEPPSSPGLPGRSRPALSELSKETTEGDLWNLDDELAEAAPPRISHPPLPRQATKPEELPEAEESPATAKVAAAASEADEPASGPQAPKPRGKTPAQSRPDHDSPLGNRAARGPLPDEIGDLDEPREIPPRPAPAAQPSTTPAPQPAATLPEAPVPAAAPSTKPAATSPASAGTRPRITRREAVNLAAFAFVLLLAAIWVLTRFFSLFEFKSQFVEMPDFPLKGRHASIGEADTFWREPIRDGEQRDFARREVAMIPVLQVTLDPDSSTGALLVIFRNGEGEPVGDAIRRSFRDGRFDASGNATITFPATDGFVEEGNYHAYRTGKGEPWMAEVLEGPSVDAPAGNFHPLAPIPVSTLRR
jgi:hypothetical protein